ncbi:hypothetical protein BJY04DRAFT_205995 [Aspergillus karnatakaensis]|uniref:uncharacterized protein n=1 Tax=Aspergillus karnatakaensis TaxID=1810916 RepID=UPI003CCE0301
MTYYEPQGWQAPSARQPSWEQPVPPSRSGSSSVSQRDDMPAFSSQFDEVDRAIDNLVKSGKLWAAPRRDSMPMMMGRPHAEYGTEPRTPSSTRTYPEQPFTDSRASNPAQRHHSISDFDGARMHPSPNPNVQGFYASQRFQGRPNEVDQMMQAKRRMAAQRERELRNYHQEQQYNRSLLAEMSAGKSDRSLSPAAMSEESRRELLARQHRALYGNESPAFFPPSGLADDGSRPESQAGVRGASPRSIDPFSQSSIQGGPDSIAQANANASALQSPSRANSTSSPSSGINPVFGKYDSAEQPVTSASSPGADSPSARQAHSKATAGPIGSVGPIGSRPAQQSGPAQAPNPALNKRSTTPLPSPLGFGFTPEGPNDRSVPSVSNVTTTTAGPASAKDTSGGVGLGWSNSSGVWGSKAGLGVQASVWG